MLDLEAEYLKIMFNYFFMNLLYNLNYVFCLNLLSIFPIGPFGSEQSPYPWEYLSDL